MNEIDQGTCIMLACNCGIAQNFSKECKTCKYFPEKNKLVVVLQMICKWKL